MHIYSFISIIVMELFARLIIMYFYYQQVIYLLLYF